MKNLNDFDLIICGRNFVNKYLPADYIISFHDSSKEPPNFGFSNKHHLVVRMDDTIDYNDLIIERVNEIRPNIEHIEKVLNFSKNIKFEDKLIVHCEAGVSRSSSMAWGLLVAKGFEPDVALTYLSEKFPQIYPNEIITGLWSKYLQIDMLGCLKKFQNDLAEKDRIFYETEERLVF